MFAVTGHEDKHGEAGFSNAVVVHDEASGLRYLVNRGFNGLTPTRAPTLGALTRTQAGDTRAARLSWAFRSLWRPNQSERSRVQLDIAHTAVVRDGRPHQWLFTSAKSGRVMRKAPENTDVRQLTRQLARAASQHASDRRGARYAVVLRVSATRGYRTLLLPASAVPGLADGASANLWQRVLSVQEFVPAERDGCLSTFATAFSVASDGRQRCHTRKLCKTVAPLGRKGGGGAAAAAEAGEEGQTAAEALGAARAEDRLLQQLVQQAFGSGCTAHEVASEESYRCLEARVERQLNALTRDVVRTIQRYSGETIVALTAEFVPGDDGPILIGIKSVFTLADDAAKSAEVAKHREATAVYQAVQDLCADPLLAPPPEPVRGNPVALSEAPAPEQRPLSATLPRKPPVEEIALARTPAGHLFPSTELATHPEHRVPGCGGDFCDWNRGVSDSSAGPRPQRHVAVKSIMLASAELRRAGGLRDDPEAPYIPDRDTRDQHDGLGHGKRELSALKGIAGTLRRFRAHEGEADALLARRRGPRLAVPACSQADVHTRAFYDNVLRNVNPQTYYTLVPVCHNCFKVYTHLDKRRDEVLQDYSVAMRASKPEKDGAGGKPEKGSPTKGRWLQFATPSRKALRQALEGGGVSASEPETETETETETEEPPEEKFEEVRMPKRGKPHVLYVKDRKPTLEGSMNRGADGERIVDVARLVGGPNAQLWPEIGQQEQLFVRQPDFDPSLRRALEFDPLEQRTAQLQRPTASSAARSRPGSASRSRPGSASSSRSRPRSRPGSRPGSAAGSRPGSRPGSASSKSRARPKSAHSRSAPLLHDEPHLMQNRRAPWREPAKAPPAPLLNLAEAFLAPGAGGQGYM